MTRQTLTAFSVFPYFTKANVSSQEQRRLQGLLYAVKHGQRVTGDEGSEEDATAWFARVLSQAVPSRIRAEFLGNGVVVVPMPSSSITQLPPSRAAWPMLDVAMLLKEAKAVAGAFPALVRHTAVKKSHLASSAERPSVEEHADSLTVNLRGLPKGCGITILDDVVSSGTNVMGADLALRRAGFRGEIRVLTATHTVGSDYSGGDTASARSLIVWLEGRKARAFRPSDEIEFLR